MKTIDVNIMSPVVTNNVQLISKIGSNLGTQFCKVESRFAWQGGQEGFERDKKAIENGEKKGFILNRSPKRLLAKNFLIAGTVLMKDPMNDDEVGIAINPHDDGSCDLFLPITENTLNTMGKTTAEAVAEAIKGERDHFFLDAKTLVKILNDAMRREISYLEEHIQTCQKMLVTLKGDISNNENKAKMIEDSWINSALKTTVDMPGGSGTIVTVNKTED
jgi:hypothetical protein